MDRQIGINEIKKETTKTLSKSKILGSEWWGNQSVR